MQVTRHPADRSTTATGWPAGLLLAGVLVASCGDDPPVEDVEPWVGSPQVVLAERPPFSEGQWPCSDCHEPDLPVRTKVRKLETAHEDLELHHGTDLMWCFDCHDVKDRDRLRTASGRLLEYEDAHLLCGQCHGHQLRDWEHGAHGRRTGSWAGTMTSLRCVHCHDAHSPHFAPVEPMPPPPRPVRTR